MSASEFVSETFGRFRAPNEHVNAIVVVLQDRALQSAARVDRALASGAALPLAGVPVAVKDHVFVAGAPATNGSRTLADFVPGETCLAVRRLENAGAVVVGKTNNPEFCYSGSSASPVFGTTRNPWNLTRSPGGSSGGSAAAVAAGMVPLAVGTDGGGSIRTPAAFCGVVGCKPTRGIVPTRPGFRGWPSLSVHGPMAANVADAALMLQVMAGLDPSDPVSVPFSPVVNGLAGHVDRGIDVERPLNHLRVGYCVDLVGDRSHPHVASLVDHALEACEDLGAELHEITRPFDMELEKIWRTIARAESYASEGSYLGHPDLTPTSQSVLEEGAAVSAREYLDAQERRVDLLRRCTRIFASIDVLLMTGQPVVAPPIQPLGGQDVGTGSLVPNVIANLTGQPAVAIPVGITPCGLPAGVQILAPRFRDHLAIGVAATLEGALEASGRWLPGKPAGIP